MTRYTELRHAGYYQPNLTDDERDVIAAKVDGTTRTVTPKGSTVVTTYLRGEQIAKSTKAAKGKRSAK